MKKIFIGIVAAMLSWGFLAGCGVARDEITVITREDGSGTRGAFIELFGIEEKDDDGKRIDHTTVEAIVATSTAFVLNNTIRNPNAIGYISLGSLSDVVKAVRINGAEPTVEDVKDGSYVISRPFLLATKGEVSEITKDFMDFMLSSEGQAVVEENHYIPSQEHPAAYAGPMPRGTVNISGSSSVGPVMEKLLEAYRRMNANATINLNTNDSTTGLSDVVSGVADIGMASRDLSENEQQQLTPTTLAIDGIAVVVNIDNPVDELTKDQVQKIYIGEITTWEELKNP